MSNAARFPVSDHCDGRRFFNPDPIEPRGLREVLRWKFSSRPARWSTPPVRQTPPRSPLHAGDIRATWINHSTFLLETPQGNLLTDPVYSPCCGPFGRLGPRRVHAPGLALHQLPEIHYVLLSHDHYDHCDLPTLRLLAQAHEPVAITPLGNRDLFARAGFTRIVELDWWQNHSPTPNLDITVTPARHWSNRLSSPRFSRLWGGFFIKAGSARLYFASDTGYHPTLFTEIRRKLGSPDLAMIPIGAYEPRWFMREQHCNPAEAVQIHCDVGARTSVAMHWGTFQLTDEGRDDPPLALRAALVAAGLTTNDFQIPEPGGSIAVSTLTACPP
jgi:L-ascorbate metabolism protein UlaG (beta-lactamase superfamily)